jgi:uncharacterized protein YbaR (Trm112 family)
MIKKCPFCEKMLEILQHNQWVCEHCRKIYIVSDIEDEEMIEWFCD